MRRYLTFIAGGGMGFLLIISTTIILTEIFNLWYAFSYAIGLAVGTSFKFLYHRRITFNKPSRWKTRLRRFIILVVMLNVIKWLLVYAGAETVANMFKEEVTAIYYLPTIFLVNALLSMVNFVFNKHWVFKN